MDILTYLVSFNSLYLETLLHIDHLDVYYHLNGRKALALKNIEMELKVGEICAVLGKTGSGKSTLFNSILGTLSSNAEIALDAKIILKRNDLLQVSSEIRRQLRRSVIASMPQNPLLALNPTMTCGRQVSEVIDGNREEKKKRVLQLLKQVQIPNGAELLQAFPHQVSLGQLQRISLAIALANTPDVILADEPFASLDPENVELLSNLFLDLRNQGTSILMITHDLNSTANLSDKWIWLHEGEIVGHGKGSIFESNSKLAGPIAAVVQAYQQLSSRTKSTSEYLAHPLLTLQNINYHYDNRNQLSYKTKATDFAISKVDLEIYQGEILGIVGPSGSGKSTLAKIIGGLIDDFEGICTLDTDKPYYSYVQYIMQDASTALPPLRKVGKLLEDILNVYKPALSPESKRQQMITSLSDVGLPESYLSKSRYQLSGGEKQRVILARALIVEPQLLVMDESLNALDRDIQLDILAVLQNLVGKYGLALVLVSHDHELIKKYCHRLISMEKGAIRRIE